MRDDTLNKMISELNNRAFADIVDGEIKWQPYDDYGDIMPIAEFVECVKCGGFIPYDGSGNWATETQISDQSVWETKAPEWATHVAWYNR